MRSIFLHLFTYVAAGACAVAGCATATGQVTYLDVDWTSGNTVDAATGLDPVIVDNVATATNTWSVRYPFGNGLSLLQGRGDSSPTSTPELITTVAGLAPANYDLFVFYWSTGGDWSIRAGLASGALSEYNTWQPPASSLQFVSDPIVSENDRTLYAAKVGENIPVSGGSVDIFINDLGSTASNDRTWYDGVGYRLHVPSDTPANYVAGELITFTNTPQAPNGAWSWFEDERVIVDESAPAGPRIVVSSVSYASSGDEAGDVDVLWYDVNTGQQGAAELHDRLQVDDHNSAALWIRPDGRYLASYSTHTTGGGVAGSEAQLVRFRVSEPHDPSTWGPEYTHLADGFRITTYSNLHFLPEDDNGNGRLYNFHRNVGFDPHILVSSDNGDTWTEWGNLLAFGDDTDRPYLKYASDGEKIHFIATEAHPQSYNNSIFHGYVQNGQLFSTSGALLDSDLSSGAPLDVTALTPVFNVSAAPYQGVYSRAWTVDTAIDSNGNPYAVFQARIDPGAVSGGNDPSTHQFFYAKHDGLAWNVHELAKAGADIRHTGGGNGYTGLIALDPQNADVLYVSTDIDPRDGTSTAHYEIYRGQTTNGGGSWSWSPITQYSSVDNVRPIVPEWDGPRTALLWMRGNYTSYTNWNTEVVGIITVPGDHNLDGAVDAADYVAWRKTDGTPEGYANWRKHFGLTNGGAGGRSASADSTTLPEPDSPIMLALLAAGILAYSFRESAPRAMRMSS